MSTSPCHVPSSVFLLPREDWGPRDDNGLDWPSAYDGPTSRERDGSATYPLTHRLRPRMPAAHRITLTCPRPSDGR